MTPPSFWACGVDKFSWSKWISVSSMSRIRVQSFCEVLGGRKGAVGFSLVVSA